MSLSSTKVFGVVLISTFLALFSTHSVSAENTDTPTQTTPADITLTCNPGLFKTTEGSKPLQFEIIPGTPIALNCFVQNSTEQEFTTLLLVKQTGPGGVSASSSDMKITEKSSSQATLTFNPVFQTGSYLFSFSLIDTATKQPIGTDFIMVGTIEGGEQPHILRVFTDKTSYNWADPIKLSLFMSYPEYVDNIPLRTEVIMLDESNNLCVNLTPEDILLKNQRTIDIDLVLPNKDAECANTLTLTNKLIDGTIIEKKSVAINLPDRNPVQNELHTTSILPFSSLELPRFLTVGLVLTGIVILVLIIYFLFKKKK